jgi:LuxR family maltose regulon positive regulatory protein
MVDEARGGLGAAPTIGALTPSQSAIARLVALGRTNREVAIELDLSSKTVEWNLTRIYRLIGVRSRTELAARYSDSDHESAGAS